MKITKLKLMVGTVFFAFLCNVEAAEHPAYLHALSDLRAARWLIDHRPGNWQQATDEVEATRQIDMAIEAINKAAIDDGKKLEDHPPVDEIAYHFGRLHEAAEYLEKARKDVGEEEDNSGVNGLKDRALAHIREALIRTRQATTAAAGEHPAYLHALSDLRAARWMIEHRPGNWQQTEDEMGAVRQIDMAIGEITKAAVDDGKNTEDHPAVDEKPDHIGRLHEAADFLEKARADVNQEEDNSGAEGLKERSLAHVREALLRTRQAIDSTK